MYCYVTELHAYDFVKKKKGWGAVLAGVVQWIEYRPENQRVASSIPSLGHVSGLQARSPVGNYIKKGEVLFALDHVCVCVCVCV